MSDTPDVSGDDPEAYEDENVVPCPACDSTNTVQFAARGIQYQCQDCNNEFDPSAGPMDINLE
jgi:ribosomal protein L37AE/L43A